MDLVKEIAGIARYFLFYYRVPLGKGSPVFRIRIGMTLLLS
jgi:hypothetical protein